MKKLKKFTTFEALKSWERKPVKSDADLEKHAELERFIEEIKSVQKKDELPEIELKEITLWLPTKTL